MGILPKSKRHVEKLFQHTRNVADGIDKISTVIVALGFGDPSGATLTVGAAVGLAAKAVAGISGLAAEFAGVENPDSDAGDHRTTLIVYAANLAYFTAVDEVLSPHVADLADVAIPRREACVLEDVIAADTAHRLLTGESRLFSLYEEQLRNALRNAGTVWSEREALAADVTARAKSLFRSYLTREEKPYSTLQKLLHNEAIAQIGSTAAGIGGIVEDAVSRATATGTIGGAPKTMSAPPAAPSERPELAPVFEQRFGNVDAKLEQIATMLGRVQSSAADEVGVLLLSTKKRFDRAKVYLDSGKFVQASVLFDDVGKELATLEGDEARALRARAIGNRGHALLRQGQTAEAIALFREAHGLAPTNNRLRVSLGVAELLDDQPGKAEGVLHDVLRDNPAEADVVELLAESMARRGEISAALEFLESHRRDGEHFVEVYSNLLLKAGRTDEAESQGRDAVRRWHNSHHTHFCLALAIAAPLLEKLDDGAVLTSSIRQKLGEAMSHLEKAVALARKGENDGRLAVYLTNLCGVASAIARDDVGLLAGEEALRLNPNDPYLLRNLFVSQFLADRYTEAAATARALDAVQPGPEATLHEMQACMAAGFFDRALAAYDAAEKQSPSLADDPPLIAHRAECIRRRPDLDAADQLLADAVKRIGRVPTLLAQQAEMAAIRGDHGSAEKLFTEAERTATGKALRVVRRQYGLYLYSSHRWSEALTRLVEPQENPVFHPACVEYLHCLYQLKQMPEVARLALEFMGTGQFNAGIWELAAKALSELGRVRDAERVMGELVQRHPTERGYREYAFVRLRASGPTIAITVLESARVLYPTSFWIVVNLSGLYFTTRQYRRAFDAARRAVELSPESEEAHTAMARIVGAPDTELRLSEEEKQLLQQSLLRSKAVTRIEMAGEGETLDLSNLIAVLKEQRDRVEQVMELYRKHRLPLAMVAKALGRDFADIWFGITGSLIERYYIAEGSEQEQETERKVAYAASGVSIDYAALLTAEAVGLLPTLSTMFSKIFVATATRERIGSELDALRAFARSTANIGYESGGIRYTELPPEFHETKVNALAAIVAFLDSPAVTIEGLSDDGWSDWQARTSPEVLPDWSYHPILVAKANKVPLYTDEQGVRSIAHLNHQVSGFCTQGLIRGGTMRGILSVSAAESATVKLVALNGDFVSLSGSEVRRYVLETGFARSVTLSKLFRQLEATRYADQLSPQILAFVLAAGWFELEPASAQRQEWFDLCIDSLNAASNRSSALLHLAFGAGVELVHFPESYCGLLHHLVESPKLSQGEKAYLRDAMGALIRTVAAAAAQAFPGNRRVTTMWARFDKGFRRRQKLLGYGSG